MNKKIDLSIVIPAYNEEKRIKTSLEDILRYMKKQSYEAEIIVVDDGSTDDTNSIIKEVKKEYSNIRLLSYKENKGKGYAVQVGMLHATGKYVMYMDADGAIDIEHIEAFWPELKKGYDIVIGSTEIGGVKRVDDNAWYRKVLGKLSKYLIRFMATPGIHDTQRAFKIFPRDVAHDVFKRQTIERWGFDIEILVIARKRKYLIKELPVLWINPDGSHEEGLMTYIATLKELFEITTKSLLGYYRGNAYPTIPTLSELEIRLQGTQTVS